MDLKMTPTEFYLPDVVMSGKDITCPKCGGEGVEETLQYQNVTIVTKHYRCADRMEYARTCDRLKYFFEDRAMFVGQLVGSVLANSAPDPLKDLMRETTEGVQREREMVKKRFEDNERAWNLANDRETIDEIMEKMDEAGTDMEKQARVRELVKSFKMSLDSEEFEWPDDLEEVKGGIQ